MQTFDRNDSDSLILADIRELLYVLATQAANFTPESDAHLVAINRTRMREERSERSNAV